MSSISATIYLDTNRTIAEISPLLFGGFVEHMGRCVYEGIYDPKSPLAGVAGPIFDVMSTHFVPTQNGEMDPAEAVKKIKSDLDNM